MRTLVLLLSLIAAGCGDKKKANESDGPQSCRSDDDCPGELLCRRYECTDPAKAKAKRGRALPSTQGVTPAGVKREVDGISREYERKVDKSLDD